jgi:hypothetical protein
LNQDGNLDIITFDMFTKDLYYFLGNGDSTFMLNAGGTTSVKEEDINSLVKVYPNPFHESVTVELSLPVKAFVRIQISDMYGRLIAELVNGDLTNQNYRYQWHPEVSSGIYLLKVNVNQKQKVYKLIND